MIRIGTKIVIDGWREAVVCDMRPDGFYAMCGDNHREFFTFDSLRWKP